LFFVFLFIFILLLYRYDTVESLVRTYYPNHPWDHDAFTQSSSPSTKPGFTPQLFMERVIRSLFPAQVKIETNLRARHGIVGDAGVALEIDVYLPEYKLAFEYQVSFSLFYFLFSFSFSFFFLNIVLAFSYSL